MNTLGTLLGSGWVAGLVAGAALPAEAGESKRPPDVIFFMTDQQRWDAIGALNNRIKTPNLDRIAKSGIIYRQATCQAPMCVPSRNSMMFGLYPSRVGVVSNGSPAVADDRMPTAPLPEMLHRAGYQTAGFGKTHWGKYPGGTSTRGFETRVLGLKQGETEAGARYWIEENPNGAAAYHRETADYGGGEESVAGFVGCTSQVAESDHRDGWIAEECLKWLDTGVDADRPLFLYLSFYKPHAGLNVPKRFEDLYDINDIPDTLQPPWEREPDTHLAYSDSTSPAHARRYKAWREAWIKMTPMERRRTTLRYYANCSWLDDYFGRAMDKLEKLGRLKNAMIVFVSDHGEMLGERQFRFTKYCLYDSSVRVPMILGGSVIPPERRGTIDDRPAELVDIRATIARVTGVKVEEGLPGLDLLGEAKHEGSFCEYHEGDAPAYMWRTPGWKLILFKDRRRPAEEWRGELYDLTNDPNEWRNVYGEEKHAAVREQMKGKLLAHLEKWHLTKEAGK